LLKLQEVLAEEEGPSVVWLQAQSCSGCSVSLLNSIHYATIDDLLINTLDLNFHSTVMSAAGDLAVGAAEAARAVPGYVLVVEGAIPTAAGGEYCYLWPGMTALQAVQAYSQDAGFVLAVGTCAAYGGIPGGAGNLTNAKGLSEIVGRRTPVINLPGCPAHPDWIVGTIVHLLTEGRAPNLDICGRPRDFYRRPIHSQCPNRQGFFDTNQFAGELGEEGCLFRLGCRGQWTASDCPIRQWNSAGAGEYGVNWCIGAGAPCQGCTEPAFPDGMSPFYTLEAAP
jgi:hydrogenase small subunit